ncbi:MAG: DUF2283 domain-containing protein [Candidatus Sungbacteria bacterium]|nr:DUF2283 domain-containing protein [Candidatus Sungbacteria bacterium]
MKLYYFYDQEADVFYASQGKPSSCVKTRETSDDVLLRLHPKTEKIVGFTILNFHKRLEKTNRPIALPIEANLMPA